MSEVDWENAWAKVCMRMNLPVDASALRVMQSYAEAEAAFVRWEQQHDFLLLRHQRLQNAVWQYLSAPTDDNRQKLEFLAEQNAGV